MFEQSYRIVVMMTGMNECLSNNNYHLMPVVCYQHHHHNGQGGQGGQCSNNITITRALAAVYQGIRLLY